MDDRSESSFGNPTNLPALDVRVEYNAQQLLNDRQSSADTLGVFEDELESVDFAPMLQHKRYKAAWCIARTLRKTAFAAVSHEVYTELLHQITPKVESGEPLAAYPSFPEGYNMGIGKRPLKGSAAQFMHRMTYLLFGASQRYFTKVDGNPASPEHCLWEALDGAHFMFKLNGGKMHPDTRISWFDSMRGNAEAVLEILLHAGYSQTQSCGRFPSKTELLRDAAKNVDAYTWGASTNSSFIVPTLHTNPLSREFYKYEGRELDSIYQLFPGHKLIFGPSPGNSTYKTHMHPSLREHSWSVERSCPGVPILSSTELSDRQESERFFVSMEQRYGRKILRLLGEHDIGNGSFDRVTVALLLGMLASEDTIYDAWPRDRLSCLLPGNSFRMS